jgi:hypothetical protein
MDGDALGERMLDLLMKDIKHATFPSVTMMNRVEAALTSPDQLGEYAEILLEKVESARFPSIAMLNRLDALRARLG